MNADQLVVSDTKKREVVAYLDGFFRMCTVSGQFRSSSDESKENRLFERRSMLFSIDLANLWLLCGVRGTKKRKALSYK
jgi:hypothetical protein